MQNPVKKKALGATAENSVDTMFSCRLIFAVTRFSLFTAGKDLNTAGGLCLRLWNE